MKGVRHRPEGFEGQCEACLEWWPIELEFWDSRKGMRKCRACIRDRGRVRAAGLRMHHVLRRRRRKAEWQRAYRARKRNARSILSTVPTRNVDRFVDSSLGLGMERPPESVVSTHQSWRSS